MCLTPRQHRCEGLGTAPEGHTEQMGWEGRSGCPGVTDPLHVVAVW